MCKISGLQLQHQAWPQSTAVHFDSVILLHFSSPRHPSALALSPGGLRPPFQMVWGAPPLGQSPPRTPLTPPSPCLPPRVCVVSLSVVAWRSFTQTQNWAQIAQGRRLVFSIDAAEHLTFRQAVPQPCWCQDVNHGRDSRDDTPNPGNMAQEQQHSVKLFHTKDRTKPPGTHGVGLGADPST